MKFISASLALVMLATNFSPATCGRRVAVAIQHHDDYVAPIIAATFVPVIVPAYTISYTPPPVAIPPMVSPSPQAVPAQPLAAPNDCSALRDEVAKLRAELAAFKSGQPLAAQAPDRSAQVTAIFAAKCAACHDAANAATKGKGHVWLQNGKLAQITPAQWLRISQRTFAKTMPPSNVHSQFAPLTDEEYGVLNEYMGTVK